ncbi:MAG TPA: S-adenosylmethionine decarboxylase [Candidatus Paceibacterota bacterium]|nr:S-adenosylmethionine decarboxylase [Candidatus Paceibacterota bacterium]
MAEDQEKKDEAIINEYKEKNPWGLAVSIDLKDCDLEKMKDADYIKNFVRELCELIGMQRYGETTVVNFGENERVFGFSMTQLIETSLISAHFANVSKAIYLDVFSCKEYPPYKVAEFAKERFLASDYRITINYRF